MSPFESLDRDAVLSLLAAPYIKSAGAKVLNNYIPVGPSERYDMEVAKALLLRLMEVL